MELALFLLIAAVLFGGYMAWTIGANDVANAFGTSVGSGAITIFKAVLIAAVFEFAGAFFVGAHVTRTISGNIITPDLSVITPLHMALGMTCALLAAALWLHFATHLGWPVSTTHAIVGSVLGLGLVFGGIHAINWSRVGVIALSWVISPAVGALLAIAAYTFFVLPIYRSQEPMRQLRRMAPVATGMVFALIALSMVYKGLANLNLNLPIGLALLYSIFAGIIAGGTMHLLMNRRRLVEGGSWHLRVKQTEPVFATLQVITACYMSFAHGANDVANAIGPLATVLHVFQTGELSESITVPPILLAFGGVGIIIGLATYGYKVIETVGKKITAITPSRGFAAEFGCATTVLICSKLGLPVSTTHTIVGAVVGVGLVRGLRSLDLRVLRDIGASWVATIPAAALLTSILYLIAATLLPMP